MRAADRLRPSIAAAVVAIALCVPAGGVRADGARTSHALRAALSDPGTWIPAAAAVIVALTGRDHEICDRAAEDTPVFGSRHEAIESSDVLRETSYVGMVATTPLVPRAQSSFEIWGDTMLAEHAGLATAAGVTWTLKRITRRERPDGSDFHSFPSGHATRAFAARGAIAYNLHRSTLARPARIGADAAFTLVAAGTAWARIEGGAHHTTDALAGAAIGNFFGRFLAEALVPEKSDLGTRHAAGLPIAAVTVRF